MSMTINTTPPFRQGHTILNVHCLFKNQRYLRFIVHSLFIKLEGTMTSIDSNGDWSDCGYS